MATKPRKRSESGFYHVFQRGVSLFDIFEDDEDRAFYLKRLVRYASEQNVEIHAWCLMSNHTHLLLRAEKENLSCLMRRLGSVYARYFNSRHGRTGPLFEGRFGSVCVETEPQVMALVRYIHFNPVHHEEDALMSSYPWSSYGEYSAAAPSACRIDFVLSLFGSAEGFLRFHEREPTINGRDRFMDIGTIGPMKDEEARERANRVLREAGFAVLVSSVGSMPRKQRDRALACVKRAIGCSIRQLQRLTSIAYSAIRNAVRIVFGNGHAGNREGSGNLENGESASLFFGDDMNDNRISRCLPIEGPVAESPG